MVAQQLLADPLEPNQYCIPTEIIEANLIHPNELRSFQFPKLVNVKSLFHRISFSSLGANLFEGISIVVEDSKYGMSTDSFSAIEKELDLKEFSNAGVRAAGENIGEV